MVYQALLFCPDEKTARIVEQILSELDFTVTFCAEPFAAIKKLMDEHFDAIVVDCDNEQNASLLFKSARHAPTNHGSLAVAVAEGQAGVAMAFRIGANLVLTKPINVEQTKGTLRVARGLLRKNQAAKSATEAATSSVPLAPKTTSFTGSTPRFAEPVAPLTKPARANAAKAASVPIHEASRFEAQAVDHGIAELNADLFEAAEDTPSSPTPNPAPAASRATTSAGGFAAGFGTGVASAPAKARDRSSSAISSATSSGASETESPVAIVAAITSDSSLKETNKPEPVFTVGGNIGVQSAGGGSKMVLLAVAAMALIAAAGYVGWLRWGHPNGATTAASHVAAKPVADLGASPQTPPSAAPQSVAPSAPLAEKPAGSPTADFSFEAQPTKTNAPSHPNKATADADSPKASASTAKNVQPTSQPIVVQPIMVSNGTLRTTPAAVVTDSETAPTIPAMSTENNGALPKLIVGPGNAPAPVLETVNLSQGVSQGLLLKETQPIYPASALRMRVEGSVQLQATISKKGDISAVKVLSGDLLLARAAADAVKQWKYKPYLLNGAPVEVLTPVTVKFKLPH